MSLECIHIKTGDNPQFAIIWLHGLGADGHDFEPIAPQVSENLPPIHFIFPHAPIMPVTINGGMEMRAWYDIKSTELNATQDKEGIEKSSQQIQHLMQELVESGIPIERQVLAGFSQGGAIALHTAIRMNEKCAGIIALSTYLPLASEAELSATDTGKQQNIFYGHGTQDPVVPVGLGELSRNIMLKLGLNISWHTYPMPHAVCPQEIDDIAQWLTRTLNK